jgi:hypothetical protein
MENECKLLDLTIAITTGTGRIRMQIIKVGLTRRQNGIFDEVSSIRGWII